MSLLVLLIHRSVTLRRRRILGISRRLLWSGRYCRHSDFRGDPRRIAALLGALLTDSLAVIFVAFMLRDRSRSLDHRRNEVKPSTELVVAKDKGQILSDAYLRFALRMVKQQRTIEQLKRG